MINKKITILGACLVFLLAGSVASASWFSDLFNKNLGATTLQVFQGGTGRSTFPSGECLKGNLTGAITTGVCSTGSSPLTTKGDLYTYTTVDFNLPVGTNGQVLMASSTTASGLAWASAVAGTVTSVDMSVPTGLTIGGNPITTAGTLALTYSGGYEGFKSASGTDYNTAYANRVDTWTAPLQFSANTASITVSASTTNGYLTSTDWNIFNQKADASAVGNKTVLYYWNAAADLAGFEMLRKIPNGGTEVAEATTTVANTRVLLDKYISSSTASQSIGGLTFTSVPAGTYNFHTWAQTSNAGGTNVIVYEVYKRASSGVETLLFTATSSALATAVTELNTAYTYAGATSSPDGSDRFLIKPYAYSSSSGRTITWYYDGTTRASHVETTFTTDSTGFTIGFHDEVIIGAWTFPSLTVNGIIGGSGGTSTDWNTAYTDRLKWDGGATGLTAATGRTSLGLGTMALEASSTYYLASNPSSYISTESDPIVKALSGIITSNGSTISAITNNSANWDKYNQWDGGSTGLVAATGRTSLGLTDTATLASTTWALSSHNQATSTITGIFGVASGGTGASTLTGLLLGNGTSPVTTITNSSANWDTAYTDRLKWDGGSTGLTAATGRTSLGLGTMALEANTGSTTITTLGTIGTGVWGGTAIPVNKGGTGQDWSAVTAGSIPYFNTLGVMATLASTTGGSVLQLSLTTGKPSWVATSTLGLGGGASNFTYYPAFTYATSTAWSGTTTMPLGVAYTDETWNGVKCFTDTGTTTVSFYDGTNRMNLLNASTTVNEVLLTTNNTFTAGEKRYVDLGLVGGAATATATKISCSVSRTMTGGGGNGVNNATIGQTAYYGATNAVSGTSTIFIDTNSNVGIGTTTPKYALTVNYSTGKLFQVATTTNQNILTIDENGSLRFNGNYFSIGSTTAVLEDTFSVFGRLGEDIVDFYDNLGSSIMKILNSGIIRLRSGVAILWGTDTSTSTGYGFADFNGHILSGHNVGNATTTKWSDLNDPDDMNGVATAAYGIHYSDDTTRFFTVPTAVNGVAYLRNSSFSGAVTNKYYGQAVKAQSIAANTMYSGVITYKGIVTYMGFHYAMISSTTQAANLTNTTFIKMAISSDFTDISLAANWASTTISGTNFFSNTIGLLGVANNQLWVASSSTVLVPYTISTSTKTLTAGTPITLGLVAMTINNTRVNETGIYAGTSTVPFLKKHDFTGTYIGYGMLSAAAATTPDLFVTRYSLYAIDIGPTTQIHKIVY